MNEDVRHIEFLVGKSQSFIEKQISAYRQKQTNSGSIIAIISLFIPFFLNGLSDATMYFKFASIIPIGLFAYSIYSLMQVIKSRPLDHGFHTRKFQELVKLRDYKKVLLYEIGANQSSFIDNAVKIDCANKNFMSGIKITFMAVLISLGLLGLINFFPAKNNDSIKVEIIKK